MRKEKTRLGYLDSMRGIAAISVLIFHSILSIYESSGQQKKLAYYFYDYFDLGKIAVICFFLISGFVIPYSIKEGPKLYTIKKFVVSRFFRLYPIYWLSVLLGYIIVHHLSIKNTLINLSMMQQFFGIPNMEGIYWTLQIELVFYFLIVILLLIGKLNSPNILFIISVMFLIISLIFSYERYISNHKIPIALTLGLSIMFFGAYYRRLIIQKDQSVKKIINIYLSAYFLLIPIISFLAYNKDMGYHENWIKYTITYLSGILMFIFICKIKITSKFTEFLGKISYSVYLFHTIIIFFIIERLKWHFNAYLFLLIEIILTIILSTLGYYLIENPSVKFGKKISKRYFD